MPVDHIVVPVRASAPLHTQCFAGAARSTQRSLSQASLSLARPSSEGTAKLAQAASVSDESLETVRGRGMRVKSASHPPSLHQTARGFDESLETVRGSGWFVGSILALSPGVSLGDEEEW